MIFRERMLGGWKVNVGQKFQSSLKWSNSLGASSTIVLRPKTHSYRPLKPPIFDVTEKRKKNNLFNVHVSTYIVENFEGL